MPPAPADWPKSARARRTGAPLLQETLQTSGSFSILAWNAGSLRSGTTMLCSWYLVRIDENYARRKAACLEPGLRLAPFLRRGAAHSAAGLLRAEEQHSRIRMRSPLACLNSRPGKI